MITGVYQYVDPLLELSSLFRFVSSYCLIHVLIVKLLEISGRFLVDCIQQVQTGGEGANPLKSSIATQLSLHKTIPAYSVRRRLHSFYNGSCSWQKDSKHFSPPFAFGSVQGWFVAKSECTQFVYLGDFHLIDFMDLPDFNCFGIDLYKYGLDEISASS